MDVFRSRAIAALVALAVLAMAGSGTAASVDRPSWTAGDFWTYRTNTTLTPGLNLTGNVTSTFTGIQVTVVGGSSVNADRVVLIGSGIASGAISTTNGSISINGRWTLTGEERFEPTNLHPVYSLLDVSVNGTYEYVIPIPFSLRVQNTTTFQILRDGWSYPMVVGTAGNVTMAYNFTQDLYSPTAGHLHQSGGGPWTFRFSLAAAAPIATPAGSFTAYPLRDDLPDGTWEISYMSPSAGNAVRTETHGARGNLTSLTTLASYRYQSAEPATFLGLTLLEWGLVLPAAVAAVVVAVVLVRRSRRAKQPPPPSGPEGPTSGPRGP